MSTTLVYAVLFSKRDSLQLHGLWTGFMALILAVVRSIVTVVTAVTTVTAVVQTRAPLKPLEVSQEARLKISQESFRLQGRRDEVWEIF